MIASLKRVCLRWPIQECSGRFIAHEKDTAIVSKRNLEGFLYHVSYYTTQTGQHIPDNPATHSRMLEMLWTLVFAVRRKR